MCFCCFFLFVLVLHQLLSIFSCKLRSLSTGCTWFFFLSLAVHYHSTASSLFLFPFSNSLSPHLHCLPPYLCLPRLSFSGFSTSSFSFLPLCFFLLFSLFLPLPIFLNFLPSLTFLFLVLLFPCAFLSPLFCFLLVACLLSCSSSRAHFPLLLSALTTLVLSTAFLMPSR